MSAKEIYVYVDLENISHLVGILWCNSKNGKESASFEYSKSWLKNPHRFCLEPSLELSKGSYYTKSDQNIFGSFGDSAPDRWGRVLMRRFEGQIAKEEQRTRRTLLEVDYLLGVNDFARQGAIRFSLKEGGEFLAKSDPSSIPPLVKLPKLLNATEEYLEDKEIIDSLKLLFVPGSSLGGARPKASVIDNNKNLYIAKFPRKDDDIDIVKWEAVALTLAKKSGLNVSEFKLENINNKPVLLLKRFDRNNLSRVPFLSAMSMLDAKDNEKRSYLEIAEIINKYSLNPANDLKELYKRIIFSVLISNTDDHLRNHGFLYNKNGWQLSPLYDVNPTPTEISTKNLSTNIDYDNSDASLELVLSVCEEFRISLNEAKNTISEIRQSVSEWQTVAKKFGINKKALEYMSSAFIC